MLTSDATGVTAWRRFRRELDGADIATQAAMLARRANQSRSLDLQMISAAGLGHVGGDMSVLDVLTTLVFGVARIDPERPDWEERDRLVLSKGHTAGALYATLASAGFFAEEELKTFVEPLSPLNGHPNRNKVPGVETNTGPLGHGFPVAVGMALAGRLLGSDRRVYVIVGDGELQEGSNWEAAMAGAHQRLSRLTVVVDRNRLQQGARTEDTNALEPLGAKFESFGWRVLEVDGHDHAALLKALAREEVAEDRPTCVIANTVKGKGISFMEDRVEWHHKVPTADQVDRAKTELAR
jgi:transketolase